MADKIAKSNHEFAKQKGKDFVQLDI